MNDNSASLSTPACAHVGAIGARVFLLVCVDIAAGAFRALAVVSCFHRGDLLCGGSVETATSGVFARFF